MRTLTIFCSLFFCTSVHAAFSDVAADSPYADAIEYVQKEGIVNGYSDGTFGAERPINRAEFTKIIINSTFIVEEGRTTEPLFRDVHGTEWFAPYVEAAVDEGIIEGYHPGGNVPQSAVPFYPTFRINFAEAAKIIALSYELPLDDVTDGQPWYQIYVDALNAKDALPGEFNPARMVSRGEMAEIIYRLETGKQSTQTGNTAIDVVDSYSIPILVYHHVREQEGWSKETWSWKMTVAPSFFERHMAHLASNGYTSVDLSTLASIMEGRTAGPEKPVVITFDDNNLNAYEAGVPIMEKYGMTATFYQVAGKLDTAGTIDRDMTLDLLNRGFDIQSHTMTHRILPALPVDQIDWEFQESKRILEELTGRPVTHVAYPGTSHNATVRERARLAGYTSGTLMDPRNVTEDSDYFKWPRIMMTDDTNLDRVLP